MAHFRGTIKGNRSKTSRLGHKTTGLITECNGWNIGIKCIAYYDHQQDTDIILVYKTGGSNNSSNEEIIQTIKEK